MSNSFYRAFEDRHRGSRTLIKSRLGAYLPFLAPLAAGGQAVALDLGCGRGEWLELLGDTGFAASGVDLDAGMLEACRELGLDAAIGDALSSLRARADASLDLVSAFHLIEHIPFDAVQELIGEALRALKPGGLLIMETPNPENLVVATSGFYMDPSHLRPIPPQLLDFVVGFAGFARHKVVRLQEPPQLHGNGAIELMNVLDGVSPDYSVVAQKRAEPDAMARLDAAFVTAFGLELATLARRYEAQQEQRQQAALGAVSALGERLGLAERENRVLFEGLDQLRAEMRLMRETEERARRAEQQRDQACAAAEAQAEHSAWQLNVMTVRAETAERKIKELYASTSWRVMRPARVAMTLLRSPARLSEAARRASAGVAMRTRKVLLKVVRKAAANGRLRSLAMRALARFPALDARLRALAYRSLRTPAPGASAPAPSADGMSRSAQKILSQLQQRTPDDYTDT